MITCPMCGGKRFAVYDDCDQAMCTNCMFVLCNFHMIELADKIMQKEEKKEMKIIKVLDENDLSMIVCKHFDVAPSKVKTVYNVYDTEHVSVEVHVETDSDIQISLA